MRISVSHHSPNKTEAGEIKCPYNQLGQILKTIKEHPSIRICITYPDNGDFGTLCDQTDLIRNMVDDYTIEVSSTTTAISLIKLCYKAFVRYPVTDWATFNSMQKLGVSDIWVDGPLCFMANKLAMAKGDTLLRVSPIVSTTYPVGQERPEESFYLRPEDTSEFPGDIIDFHMENQEKEDALFSIYNRGDFLFDIAQLIPGLPAGISNKGFDSKFAETRRNCEEKCQVPGYFCHYCPLYFNTLKLSTKLLKTT